MKAIGLDIGTTTISAVVVENGSVITSVTLKNGAFLPADHSWERLQNPQKIRETALEAVDTLLAAHPDAARIGLTGQMHGIVYLDASGAPVSPLYTWQDGRGDLPYDERDTYAGFLSRVTGYPLATGYGMVTHFYNLKNGLVPENASVFCTIHDYIAACLAGLTVPVTDASDAASFGMFRVEQSCFDPEALEKSGIDPKMLPSLAADGPIGSYRGMDVYVPIGDNQASFLGAVGGDPNAILVNVGTGSQFSAYSGDYICCPGLETRPFPGGYLLVGASLCGGRAYALLESFLRAALQAMTGTSPDSLYEAMDRLLAATPTDGFPRVSPLFQGTRQDPTLRGSITGLSPENFTPQHLIRGMLEGMAGELYEMYLGYLASGGKSARLLGSGNGLRRNVHLQDCFSRLFGQKLTMSECTEEAAAGAALFALSR